MQNSFGFEQRKRHLLMSDFGLSSSELSLPTSRDIVRNLDEYLDKKGVRSLFSEIAEMLLQRCPPNPVSGPAAEKRSSSRTRAAPRGAIQRALHAPSKCRV